MADKEKKSNVSNILSPTVFSCQRPPPPLTAPPIAPSSPMVQRKSPIINIHTKGPQAGWAVPKRTVEKIEDGRISRFGDATPQRYTDQSDEDDLNIKNSSSEIEFIRMLEKEEENVAEQIQKQKAFLQKIFRDKENLAQMCVAQANKLSRLDSERKEWQKRIITAEREKRDLLERIEREQQSNRQSIKKLEKYKRDIEKHEQEAQEAVRDKNNAMDQHKMEQHASHEKHAELLAELQVCKADLFRKNENCMLNKDIGDRNLKLKLDMGIIEGRNNELIKLNETLETKNKAVTAELEFQQKLVSQKDLELANFKSQIKEYKANEISFSDQIHRYKDSINKNKDAECKLKIEISKLRCGVVTETDAYSKLHKEYVRIDEAKVELEKKYKKIQNEFINQKSIAQEQEMKQLTEIEQIKDSLTQALTSNKDLIEIQKLKEQEILGMQTKYDNVMSQVTELKQKLKDSLEIQKKLQLDIVSEKSTIKDLETLIKEQQDKLNRCDHDRKAYVKAEKAKRDAILIKQETDKKECEEKLHKMKIHFEKAAVETKKQMSKLEEQCTKQIEAVSEAKNEVIKKDDEWKLMNKKLQLGDKEILRIKSQIKLDAEKYNEDIECVETKLTECRRSKDILKKKLDQVSSDLKLSNEELVSCKLNQTKLNDEIFNINQSKDAEIAKIKAENIKLNEKVDLCSKDNLKIKAELVAQQREEKLNVEILQSEIKNLNNDYEETVRRNKEIENEQNTLSEQTQQELRDQIKSKNELIDLKDETIFGLKQDLERNVAMNLKDVEMLQSIHESDINKHQEKIFVLQRKIDRENELKNKYENDIKRLGQCNDKIRKQLAEVESEKDRFADIMRSLENEKKVNNFGRYDKEKMRTEIDKLTSEKQKLSLSVESFSKEIRKLQNEITSSKQNGLQLKEQLEASQTKLKEEQQFHKDQLEAERVQMDEKIEQLGQNIQALEEINKDVTSQLQISQQKHTDLVKEMEQNTIDLEKHTQKLELKYTDEISCLTDKLSNAYEAHKSDIKKIEEIKLEFKKAQADEQKKVTCDKENAVAVETVASVDTTYSLLNSEIQKLKAENENFSNALKRIEKEVRRNSKDVNQRKFQVQLKQLLDELAINSSSSLMKDNMLPTSDHLLLRKLRNKTDHCDSDKIEQMQADIARKSLEVKELNIELDRIKTEASNSMREYKTQCNKLKELNEDQATEICEINKKLEDIKKKSVEKGKVVKFEQSNNCLIQSLEIALAEAATEREEIIASAQYEIDYQRKISFENEQKMLQDYEWKLREIELQSYKKLKHNSAPPPSSSCSIPLFSSVNTAIDTLEEILTQPEAQECLETCHLNSCIKEKIKNKRDALETVLNEILRTANGQNNDNDAEAQNWIATWDKMNKEISFLKESLKVKHDEHLRAIDKVSTEARLQVKEAQKIAEAVNQKNQDDSKEAFEALEQMVEKLKLENITIVKNYEERLEIALGTKLEHMLTLREEVEEEYSEKMESLRDMYHREMEIQADKFCREKDKFASLEASLQDTLRNKREEAEIEISARIKLEAQVDQLTTRLQNQTSEVARLEAELEEYEYGARNKKS